MLFNLRWTRFWSMALFNMIFIGRISLLHPHILVEKPTWNLLLLLVCVSLRRIHLISHITGDRDLLITTTRIRIRKFCWHSWFLVSGFFFRSLTFTVFLRFTRSWTSTISIWDFGLMLILMEYRRPYFLLICLNSLPMFWQHRAQSIKLNFMFNQIWSLNTRFSVFEMLS